MLAGLGALAAVALDDDDDDPPDTTVEVTTTPPTTAAVESTGTVTVTTDAPATTPPPTTAAPTTPSRTTPPVVEPVPLLFALADTPLDVEMTVRDPEGDPLTARIVTPAAGRSRTGAGGSFTYIPPPGSGFQDSFSVVFSDGVNESALSEVMIEVLPNVKAAALNSPVGEARGSLEVEITPHGTRAESHEGLGRGDRHRPCDRSAAPG